MKSASCWLRSFTAVLGLCSILGLVACDGGEGSEAGETGDDQSLAIVGDYVDDFMTEHSITETAWSFAGASFAIAEYDNDEMWMVAQNDEANMFNPGQWSRFDWTFDGDQLYYCQSVYDGMTIDDAKNGGADSTDLAAGCGQFAWSMLNPK
jgi:hypothetical protein